MFITPLYRGICGGRLSSTPIWLGVHWFITRSGGGLMFTPPVVGWSPVHSPFGGWMDVHPPSRGPVFVCPRERLYTPLWQGGYRYTPHSGGGRLFIPLAGGLVYGCSLPPLFGGVLVFRTLPSGGVPRFRVGTPPGLGDMG